MPLFLWFGQHRRRQSLRLAGLTLRWHETVSAAYVMSDCNLEITGFVAQKLIGSPPNHCDWSHVSNTFGVVPTSAAVYNMFQALQPSLADWPSCTRCVVQRSGSASSETRFDRLQRQSGWSQNWCLPMVLKMGPPFHFLQLAVPNRFFFRPQSGVRFFFRGCNSLAMAEAFGTQK